MAFWPQALGSRAAATAAGAPPIVTSIRYFGFGAGVNNRS
jgi:hypothetical protein